MQVERDRKIEWRTGEYNMGNLPFSGGYLAERLANTAYGAIL
jgi:hypothetical protein